jgi:hypothetical protein
MGGLPLINAIRLKHGGAQLQPSRPNLRTVICSIGTLDSKETVGLNNTRCSKRPAPAFLAFSLMQKVNANPTRKHPTRWLQKRLAHCILP